MSSHIVTVFYCVSQEQKSGRQCDAEFYSLELFSLTRMLDIKSQEEGRDMTGLADLLCRVEDRLAVLAMLTRDDPRLVSHWR